MLGCAGSLLVSAGGNQVCVWDLVGGGRLLKRLTNFQKTVTSLCVSPLAGPDSAAAPRLLAGSLDGHVKVRASACLGKRGQTAGDLGLHPRLPALPAAVKSEQWWTRTMASLLAREPWTLLLALRPGARAYWSVPGPTVRAPSHGLHGTRAQVIELDGFKVTSASRYPMPILSLALSPDCGTLAVGCADGSLVTRRHDRPRAVTVGPGARPQRRVHYKPRLTASNFRCESPPPPGRTPLVRSRTHPASQACWKGTRGRSSAGVWRVADAAAARGRRGRVRASQVLHPRAKRAGGGHRLCGGGAAASQAAAVRPTAQKVPAPRGAHGGAGDGPRRRGGQRGAGAHDARRAAAGATSTA